MPAGLIPSLSSGSRGRSGLAAPERPGEVGSSGKDVAEPTLETLRLTIFLGALEALSLDADAVREGADSDFCNEGSMRLPELLLVEFAFAASELLLDERLSAAVSSPGLLDGDGLSAGLQVEPPAEVLDKDLARDLPPGLPFPLWPGLSLEDFLPLRSVLSASS